MRFDDPYQIHKSRGALCACSERHMICQEACVLCEMRAVASSPVHINRSIFDIYDPLRPRQKAAHRSRARDDQKNQIGALSTRTRIERKAATFTRAITTTTYELRILPSCLVIETGRPVMPSEGSPPDGRYKIGRKTTTVMRGNPASIQTPSFWLRKPG